MAVRPSNVPMALVYAAAAVGSDSIVASTARMASGHGSSAVVVVVVVLVRFDSARCGCDNDDDDNVVVATAMGSPNAKEIGIFTTP